MRVAPATYGLLLALTGFALANATVACDHAHAQYQPARPDLSQRSAPAPGLDRINVVEHLGRQIPMDLPFRDVDGRPVHLRDYFSAGKPVVLTFAYHTCNTVCSLLLDSVERGLHDVPWTAGDEYQVLTVSVDPHENLARARQKRDLILRAYGREPARRGWHFLTGTEADIQALARAVGYQYFYDARQNQYGHPAAIMFLTPEGRVARYLHGLDFPTFDMRLALFESSQGRSMSTTDHILQYCYAYDPTLSTYTAKAMRVMQLGGVVTMVLLGGTLAMFWRRERRRSRLQGTDSSRTSRSPQALEVGA